MGLLAIAAELRLLFQHMLPASEGHDWVTAHQVDLGGRLQQQYCLVGAVQVR